ncbi:hypothetical protein [Pseudomonas phage vB_PseuGesM_254]|uniref:Uncharacterized protein n=1 Tax=Pseudomonas phage vB_PseuGesM_254 TaxID=3092638 RepID=A0AAX4G6C9_9CAUD|nr:hypothetical protein [Pseudomonas phage PseuGes_254]
MANKFYDATKEHTPFDRSGNKDRVGLHPNKGLKKSKHPVTGKTAR